MYWGEHSPPHFHAEYGEFKAIVSIGESAEKIDVISRIDPLK